MKMALAAVAVLAAVTYSMLWCQKLAVGGLEAPHFKVLWPENSVTRLLPVKNCQKVQFPGDMSDLAESESC